MNVVVEGCVTSVEEAAQVEAAGAGRVELCVSLECGGLTPPVQLVRDVIAAVRVPVMVLIRTRPGGFIFSEPELARMETEVAEVLEAGANGTVVGTLRQAASTIGLTPDLDQLARLVRRAEGMPVTFHKALDACADPLAAYLALHDTGVSRVLTSGGLDSAWDGRFALGQMVERRGPAVMPGGRVRADSVVALVRETGVREVHARASAVGDLVRTLMTASTEAR